MIGKVIRAALEKKVSKISDEDLAEIVQMTKDDIRFNEISFGKKVDTSKIVNIAILCHKAILKA